MSLFTDLVSGSDGVYSITNRPDLVAETKLAVRQATLAAHRSEKWFKDKAEVYLPLTLAAAFQLDIPTYFPNWRQFEYLRPFNSISQSPASFILGPDEMLATDAIFDEYANEKTNVWYVAGSNLNIRLATSWDSWLIGYYSNPVISPEANYESWIAREQPAIIVIDAAMRVLDTIGFNDAARRLEILLYGNAPGSNRQNPSGGEYQALRASNIEAFGR